ncbi:hypothetical protein [Pedobacter panaciterrae]
MKKEVLSKEAKAIELDKYKALVIATLDYCLENPSFHIITSDYDSRQHYTNLKVQVEENYVKGRLTRLKQWFRDLTEGFVEAKDSKFNDYLKVRTKSDINILTAYYIRIDKIIDSGKIANDDQFRDINSIVDYLCQTTPVDEDKITVMNILLTDYEERKMNKRGK